MNLFMRVSGGTSVETVSNAFKSALDDPQVGHPPEDRLPRAGRRRVFELADLIHASRSEKRRRGPRLRHHGERRLPLRIGRVPRLRPDKATLIGSIGVVATHRDTSAIEAKKGVVTTEIYRGRYKRIVTDGPLTDEGRAHLEARVDYFYTLFVDEVARFRGVDAQTVLATMSTDVNDLFIGEQAIQAGLADGILSFDAALQEALSGPRKGTAISLSHKEAPMERYTSLAELVAAYPEFAAQLRAEGEKEAAGEGSVGRERDRGLGLAAIQFGDEEGAKLRAIVETGTTVDQFRAIMALTPKTETSPDQKAKADILDALKKTGAGEVGADSTTDGKPYMALVEEYRAAHNCTMTVAMQAVTKAHPGKHKEYLRQVNERRTA
jgi:hypothetical protein